MDPFILAAHVQATGPKKIIDAGCGCGIMPLILAVKNPEFNMIGVEIQHELFEFACQNIAANHLESRIHILHQDINRIQACDIGGPADILISNPPYKKKGSGRLNPHSQKAIARHELTLDIDAVFHCSNRLIKRHGQVYLVFPSERISDLILAMQAHDFCAGMMRFVHIRDNEPARRVIVCAVKHSSRPCTIAPPLCLYTSENKITPEYVSMFKP